jgi:hypothetical protein
VDQLPVLDYWAQAGQSAFFGISMNIGHHAIEYWLPFTLNALEKEQPLEAYWVQLQHQWLEKLRDMSPFIARYFADDEIRHAFRRGYQGNILRVWFEKEEVDAAGICPLPEAPVPKDRWVSHDADACGIKFLSHNHRDSHQNLLSRWRVQILSRGGGNHWDL